MPTLTKPQEAFLKNFLAVRARKKGVLGGRDLAKVKEAFKDYCRRRQKVIETIRELETLPLGSEVAAPFDKALGVIDNRIDAASDLGDESVFAEAYNELEAIKKEARKALDDRKAELKNIAVSVEKFQADLAKVSNQSNVAKKLQQATELRDSTAKWIGEHHGPDTRQVWGGFQAAADMAGPPGPNHLALAARELDSEAFALAKMVDGVGTADIRDKTKSVKDRIFELGRFEQRLQKFVKLAAESGDSFVLAQLERTQALVTRAKWSIDPPPLPTVTTPLPDQSAQQIPSQPAQDVAQVPVEQLTNSALAERTLKKSEGLIKHVDEELKRVAGNLAEVKTTVSELKKSAPPSKDLLEDDFVVLDNALTDAESGLKSARDQAKTARDEFDQGTTNKDQQGKWEDHVKAVANAVNRAEAALTMCEKATGQAEGGIIYIQRSIESIESIKTRVEAVDAELLATVQEKIGLLPDCNNVSATGNELDMVKHLCYLSLPAATLRSLLGTGRDADSMQKMIRKLMESPKLGTTAVTGMLARCHQLRVDAQRYYGSEEDARKALDTDALRARFDTICAVAAQDVAKFTIPVIALTEEGTRRPNRNSRWEWPWSAAARSDCWRRSRRAWPGRARYTCTRVEAILTRG
jgi:predicted  nucleic acid-binding Zn-ribbon protein